MFDKLKALNHQVAPVINESVSGKRLSNAAMLLKQFTDCGVTIKKTDRDDIQHDLAKHIDLLPYSSISMIYSGLLGPVLVQLMKFDTFPVKTAQLTSAMNRSTDFKKKTEEFPQDIYEVMVKYKFLKWESISKSNDALLLGSRNVKDFLTYLHVIGLKDGHLQLPTKE